MNLETPELIKAIEKGFASVLHIDAVASILAPGNSGKDKVVKAAGLALVIDHARDLATLPKHIFFDERADCFHYGHESCPGASWREFVAFVKQSPGLLL